jgi:hypothetical protein
MLKQFLAVGTVLLLLLALPASAQDVPAAIIHPALETQMSELEEATETIRGLDATRDVPRTFPSREDVRDYIAEQYREQLSPELARRALAFYVALGLLEQDTDLVSLFIDVLGSQIAGFYDSDTGVMNVVPLSGDAPGESLSLAEQIIYVHEFTHALQDQYFDLDQLIGSEALTEHPDRSLAVLSLVEGDATLAMSTYLQQIAAEDPMAAVTMLAEGMNSGSLLPPEGVPDALLRELLFPYEAGLAFVMNLYNETGDWETINEAFANPPATSEHILHPETFLAGEQAIAVQLVASDDLLGDDWERVWDTTLGEYYLSEHLRTQLPRRQAANAAEGWGGDHFQVYINEANEAAWLLRLAWDTPEDANEFMDAYESFNQARVEADGDIQFGDQMACFVTEAAICVSIDSDIIASAPTFELAARLLENQLR